MTLPAHNPIDAEWLVKGVPIDHLGTIRMICECCGKETAQEQFRLVVGEVIGLGTPFFIRPFMKRQSTKGKLGGVRGLITQCTVCDSLWPFDASGRAVLGAAGLIPKGMISSAHVADYEMRKAREASSENSTGGTSRARKLN
jgi:hypothetical protein